MKRPRDSSFKRALRAVSALALSVLVAGPALGADATPSRAAAGVVLDQFRRSIWAEPVYLEFDLTQMPRRGDERVYHGRLWGSRSDQGPVTRIEVDPGKAGFTHRILIQGGADPSIWTSDGGAPGKHDDRANLQPLLPGLEMTPFDIQMPYLYWLDSEFKGVSRIRGRTTNVYSFSPPADFAAANPGIGVRAYLDAQYSALVQSEIIGPGGAPAKTVSLLELRKVGERWILKDVDVRSESTRDKTRLSVTAVAVGIPMDTSIFDPLRLGEPVQAPARIEKVSP